jgi:hypothetical protein
LALAYLRAYRTYFHISRSYGISESNCYYTLRFVEEKFIKSSKFALPGCIAKKPYRIEAILIDALNFIQDFNY